MTAQALEKLRKGAVLRDKELEPAIRVAMREIKDFVFHTFIYPIYQRYDLISCTLHYDYHRNA